MLTILGVLIGCGVVGWAAYRLGYAIGEDEGYAKGQQDRRG